MILNKSTLTGLVKTNNRFILDANIIISINNRAKIERLTITTIDGWLLVELRQLKFFIFNQSKSRSITSYYLSFAGIKKTEAVISLTYRTTREPVTIFLNKIYDNEWRSAETPWASQVIPFLRGTFLFFWLLTSYNQHYFYEKKVFSR